jgi:two-component system cell cycle response regulator
MENHRFSVLLIEDNRADARLIHELVSEVRSANLDFIFAESLSQGLSRLDSPGIDAVLLDLYLPNSQGMDTFLQVRSRAGNIPILLLTGLSDEDLAIRAVREGAQDYLVKGQVNGNLLVRAINYAIERKRLLAQLEEARQEAQRLTLIDDLTGLYNRRGFYTLSEQQWRLSGRKKQVLILLYCDFDNLKQINDSSGHKIGDQALVLVAQLLQSTFRESDIIARMGGDEFAILAIEAESNGEAMIARLNERLEAFNQSQKFKWALSLSIGWALYDPEKSNSIDDILARADAQMYQEKQSKRLLNAE